MGLFNEKSKLKEIIANDKAREIIEKYIPGALNDPGIKIALRINPTIKFGMSYRKQIGMDEATAKAFLEEIYGIE